MSERHYGNELERAWDAVRRGEPTAVDLDAWLVETLHEVHARDHVPPPEPTFVQDLREELLMGAIVAPPVRLDDPRMPNGRSASVPMPAVPGRARQRSRRWSPGPIATAAILLLTLIGSFFAFGPGRLLRPEQTPAFLPAIGGTPGTPESITIETLLDTTTGPLPVGDGIVVLKRLILQPSPKPLVVLPLSGPVFVLVASGALTATTAGTEHQLVAGDIFSPAQPEQDTGLNATGSGEAVVFLVYLQHGPDLPFPRDPARQRLEVLINGTTAGLRCPCRLVLERFTLRPGSTLPPQRANPSTWFAFEQGALGLTLEGERLPYLFKSGIERTFRIGQYVPIDIVPPGTPMTLRNAGDAPLVLYRLMLTPGEADASSAVAPAATPGNPSGS